VELINQFSFANVFILQMLPDHMHMVTQIMITRLTPCEEKACCK